MKIAGFISYYHLDGKELADCLAKYLKNLFQDFEPVYDKDIPEGNKLEEIKKKLAICNILIVIITPGTLVSKPVADEIEEAKKRKMKIIPCKDEYVNKNWEELPWDLSDYKGFEFENAGELKRKAYSALMKALEELSEEFEKSLPKKTPTEKSQLTKVDVQELGQDIDPTNWHKFTIESKKKVYNILATISNGIIENISLDRKALSLIYNIKSNNDGFLKTIIERELLDAKTNGIDDEFFVLINGEEEDFMETKTLTDRTLTILFPKGTREIEIIGSQIEGISYIGKSKTENQVKILPGSSTPSIEKSLDPETLTIRVGEEVTWLNVDSAAHTITSGTPTDGPDGNFDSSLFMAGTTFTVAFQEKGTYPYFDMVHPWIKGKIIVQ